MKILSVISFLSLLILSGCSSVAPIQVSECESANWYHEGLVSGIAGHEHSIIDDYSKICRKNNIFPDEKLFVAGYLKGMEAYCTHKNGFERGSKGGRGHKECSETPNYITGYNEGTAKYIEKLEQAKIEKLTRPRHSSMVGEGSSRY